MTFKSSILKYQKMQKKKSIKPQQKEFDVSILSKGGESVLIFVDSGEKKREICISVHTPLITYPPKYKYWYKNAFGHYVFIKARDKKLAQEVCNHLEGKGKYTVSGCYV